VVFTDPDEIEELFYGQEYEWVTNEKVVNTSRWSNFMEQVLLHKASGKHYLAQWEAGATEYQVVDLEVFLTEVEPYETTVIKYREVK